MAVCALVGVGFCSAACAGGSAVILFILLSLLLVMLRVVVAVGRRLACRFLARSSAAQPLGEEELAMRHACGGGGWHRRRC